MTRRPDPKFELFWKWFTSEPVCALPPDEQLVAVKVFGVLCESDEFGVIRTSLEAMANKMVNAPVPIMQSLAQCGLLRGAPRGRRSAAFVVTDRRGVERVLVPEQDGPIWYVAELVRLGYLHRRAAESGQRGGSLRADTLKGAESDTLKGAPDTLKGAPDTLKGAPKKPHSDAENEDFPKPDTLKGAPEPGRNTSPQGFPSPVPSPLPNPTSEFSLSAGGETFWPAPATTAEERQAAREAMDRWASCPMPLGRGYGLNEFGNECEAVRAMLESLAQDAPIPHGGAMTRRHLLAPVAADALRKAGKPFRNVKYACGCVKGWIEDIAQGQGAARPAAPKTNGVPHGRNEYGGPPVEAAIRKLGRSAG